MWPHILYQCNLCGLFGPICCRFIYTGSVDIKQDIAQDLLRAADQYLLEGLKRLCEYTIAQVSRLEYLILVCVFASIKFDDNICDILLIWYMKDISLNNVSSMYELSEAFHAVSLRQACILFILEQYDKLSSRPW